MLYYLGKGTEFKKRTAKEYKTIEGALKAAAKTRNWLCGMKTERHRLTHGQCSGGSTGDKSRR